jgi:Zn-dependent protease with chaperone function
MEQFSLVLGVTFFTAVALTTGWSLFGDRLKESQVVRLVLTICCTTWWCKTAKLPNGRKVKWVEMPNWYWLTTMVRHPVTGKVFVTNLTELVKNFGGGMTMSIGKVDLVLTMKGLYTEETLRFITEHEFGHLKDQHMFRLENAGLTKSVQRFELEADAYAASVVGFQQAYYALMEIRQVMTDTLLGHPEILESLEERVQAMREKFKASQQPVLC